MSKHLMRELELLKRDLLTIGGLVEESIQKSILSLHERREELARSVVETDEKVDQKEVEVEETCLKILALHQPVAEDLRFIAAVMKINNDLERMGDYAVSIAERALQLIQYKEIAVPKDLSKMEALTRQMVRDSLDAFIRKDPQFARHICVRDDEVDNHHRQIIDGLRKRMHESPADIDALLDLFTVTRRLERIADLATNIAQDVVYMVEGEIIRHKADEYPRGN